MIIDVPINLTFCYINYYFGEDVDFYEYSGCGGTQLGENQAEKPQGPADRCGPETE